MRTLFLLLALTLALAVPAVADEVTLDSGKDNTIYESDTGHLSNALGLNLFAGSNGAGGGNRVTRALIAFDLSEIPDGSTIQSAELIIQKIYQKNAKKSALSPPPAIFGGEIKNENKRHSSPPITAFGMSGNVTNEICPLITSAYTTNCAMII